MKNEMDVCFSIFDFIMDQLYRHINMIHIL